MGPTDPERDDRVRTIKEWLDELLDAPVAERTERLSELRATWPEVGDEVGELLAAHESVPESRMQPPARADTGAPPISADQGGAAALMDPPSRIGPYEIGGLLGKGGMGSVYRAEQLEPIARSVAIKLLCPGTASEDLVSRFRTERLLLASLDHPGIARVVDAGETEAGLVYLVMELVEGEPVVEFCRRERVRLLERMRLIIDVTSAVQHAHGRGILHRDLKPSNLLVTRDESGLRAKVIDFGVAKLVGRDPLVQTLQRTRAGQILGTLEYMSPEQAGFGDAVVDARSDVFSLGVVLYELIADRLPARVARSSAAGIAAFLHELESGDPPRPSSQLDDRSLIDVPRATLLDLECVVLRALARDPARRYPTAAALGDDVRRALDGRPVEARPPTRRYLVSRFVARHRWLVIAGALVLVSLLAGIAGVSFGLARERASARSLRTALSESDQLVDSYAALLLGARADRLGPETPLREAVMVAATRVETSTTLSPAVRGRLALAAGEVLADLEEGERASDLLRLAAGELAAAEPTPEHLRLRANALQRLGIVAIDRSDPDAAEAAFRQAIEVIEARVVEPSPAMRRSIITLEDQLASLLDELGDSMGGLALQEDAVARLTKLEPKPLEVALLRANLALTALHAGDFELAEREARAALDARRESLPADDARVLNPARILATALLETGRGAEGVALLEGLVGELTLAESDPRRAMVHASLATVRFRDARTAENARALRKAADAGEAVLGSAHRASLQMAIFRLEADALDANFDPRPELERIEAALREQFGGGSADMARAQLLLGRVLLDAGRLDLARPRLVEARDALLASNRFRAPLVDRIDALLQRAM